MASNVYRELDFVYEHDHVIIHGVIDTLFYWDQEWHVLDYKTGQVKDSLEKASEPYRYQMAAYARAVEIQTGETPRVWLYYLEPNEIFEVENWHDELINLGLALESTLAD